MPAEPFAKEATAANKKLVYGKQVILKYDVQKYDRYQRTLAYVYVKVDTVVVFVNEWLVRNGYARVAMFPPNVKHVKLFQEAEREAREQKRGLWGK